MPEKSGSAMRPYLNRDGGSGVVAYTSGKGFIVIEFAAQPSGDGRVYRYTHASCGAEAIAAMQRLADCGRGLSTYVAQSNPAYESRWN